MTLWLRSGFLIPEYLDVEVMEVREAEEIRCRWKPRS